MLARESLGLARPSRLHLPGEARLFGHTVRYADFRNLVFNFEEVFVEQQYAFRARSETPRVLDCGANIGLSVLYLKLLYPAARITAFEPSPEAFPLFQANVATFAGVTLEQKALAGSASELTIFGVPGERASLRATTVEQAGTEALAAVEAVPLSGYLEEPVDLLKLDVEGREVEILHELVATGTLARSTGCWSRRTTTSRSTGTASRRSSPSSRTTATPTACVRVGSTPGATRRRTCCSPRGVRLAPAHPRAEAAQTGSRLSAMVPAENRRENGDVEPVTTISGLPVEALYRPADAELDFARDLGDPGEFPYTRGIHPNMYRGRLWTMRQFAGFGSAKETNARFRYLLEQGQTGLSTAFDMPT